MSIISKILLGNSRKITPREETHDHSDKVDALLEKNKQIRGFIKTPDEI